MYTHVEVFKQNNDKIGQNNTEAGSYACVGSGGWGGGYSEQWRLHASHFLYAIMYVLNWHSGMKCYEIYFLKNTVFVWNFFFKFWTKGEYMESLKFIFIIIDIKALCISENWEFLTCNDKLNKQKSATCKSGKENVYRKHWVIHVINFSLDMQG